MLTYLKLLWRSIRDFSRASAGLRQLNARVYALELKLDSQSQQLMRLERKMNRLIDTAAPGVKKI